MSSPLTLWEPEERKARTRTMDVVGLPDGISMLTVGPSGDQFATGSYDGTVCVWTLGCGTWLQRIVASPR